MNLEALLGSLGTTNPHCLVNRGNAGDGLIHAGLLELSKRLGLNLQMINYPEEQTGKHLLLVGAGCFCAGSWQMVDPVRFYSKRFEKVYVLSATFDTAFSPVAKLLRELPTNVIIVCREQRSFDGVAKIVPKPENVLLDHDLAFQIDPTPWKKVGLGSLNSFRTDNESQFGRVPSPNFDISNMGREYHHTLLLDLLANFESINTDRLHVAISGALLGKNVRVFEGNYHKIRSVYEHSIKGRFPHVVLCGTDDFQRLLAETDKDESRGRLIRFILRFPKADVLRRVYKNIAPKRRPEMH